MSTAEVAQPSAEQPQSLRFGGWAGIRKAALCLYFVGLVLWSEAYGIPVQRELVILWICGALACASLGRSPREIGRMVLDWLPIVAVFLAYDFTRGAADSF